jgi:hypothetical protein
MSVIEIIKRRPYITLIPIWASLGFYRGVEEYNTDIKKYKESVYLYTNCIGFSLLISICYLNPLMIPLIIKKEIYRLEVNIRKLDKEKENPFYKQII